MFHHLPMTSHSRNPSTKKSKRMLSDKDQLRKIFYVYNEQLCTDLDSLRALIDCVASKASEGSGDFSTLHLALIMISDRLFQLVKQDIPSTSDLIIWSILSVDN